MNNIDRKIEVPGLSIDNLGLIDLEQGIKDTLSEAICTQIVKDVEDFMDMEEMGEDEETIIDLCLKYAEESLHIKPWIDGGVDFSILATFDFSLARRPEEKQRKIEITFNRTGAILKTGTPVAVTKEINR